MDTLILSTTYEPMERVSWRRAMTLLTAGRVEVVDAYDDRQVRTVSLTFDVPSVVRFVGALRWRGRRQVRFTRHNVWLRDKGRCQYCRCRLARHEVTYDHVIPRCQSGRTTWTNIVTACFACNQRKGGRTPEAAGMRLRVAPVRPRSLPGELSMTVTWDPGMPLSWRQYLTDVGYWNNRLDDD